MKKTIDQDAPKYVIERTHKETGKVEYLSPGKVNWIPPADHEKYNTRYGKWLWGDAETMSARFNSKGDDSDYSYVALPASKHI